MADKVLARNAEQGTERSFLRSTFENVWSHRGWAEVVPLADAVVEAVGDDAPTDPTDLHKLNRAQLVEVGATVGLALDPNDRKDDLIAAIEAATVGEES